MRLKTQLVLLPFVFILLVFIAFYINYSQTKVQFDNLITKSINKSKNDIINDIKKCDKLVSSILENKNYIFKQTHNKAFDLIKSNKYSLEEIKDILEKSYPLKNPNIHLYIIDKNNIVSNTTYKPDSNLDFSKFVGIDKIINRVRKNDTVYVQQPSLDVLNKKYKIYTYGKLDENRVLELGFFNDSINQFKAQCLEHDYSNSLINSLNIFVDYQSYIMNITSLEEDSLEYKKDYFKRDILSDEEKIIRNISNTKKDLIIEKYEDGKYIQVIYSYVDRYKRLRSIVSKIELDVTEYKNSLLYLERYFIITMLVSFLVVLAFFLILKFTFINPFVYVYNKIDNSEKIDDTDILTKGDELAILANTYNKTLDIKSNEFEIIFNTMKDGIAIISSDLDILECNDAFCDITRYTKDEILKKKCNEFFKDPNTPTCITELLSGDKYVIKETLYKTNGDEILTVNMKATMMPDNKRVLLTIRDITKQKRFELDLKKAENKYRVIYEQSYDGIVLIDPNSRKIVECNSRAHKQLGYTKDEYTGMSLEQFVDPVNVNKIQDRVRAILSNGYENFSTKHKRKDGTFIDIEVIAQVIELENKIFIFATYHDIGHLKLLEKQSKLASMGEMIDSIAHQWIQPLGVVKMRLELLDIASESGSITKEDILENVNASNTQIDHLLSTINEFRAFFRPKENIETLPIKSIIDAAVVLTKDEMIKKDIETFVSGDLTATVSLNSNEFKHVLLNLINNAKDAFISNNILNREINFHIEKLENSVKLSVSDNAGGIEEEIISNIFKPHFSTKEAGLGTGIGLYLSKQILDKIDATIDVENKNGGVCFTILIKK